MLKPNQLKRRLAGGKNAFGIWLHTAQAMTIEALADTGYDCLVVDNEHGPSSLEQTRAQLQASVPYDCGMCVRIPWADPVYIKQVLDLGADTLMVPMVETVEAAQAAVAACRYPPKGRRGMGPWRTMARGIPVPDYIAHMAENLFVICQIESPQAAENAAAIAAVDGVDMLFVGPYDLSGALGLPNDFENPAHRRCVDMALAGAAAAGKPCGIVPHGAHDTASLFKRGFRFVASSTDFGLMRRAALAEIAEVSAARG